jgi:membrane-associated phospholipid phosphatase
MNPHPGKGPQARTRAKALIIFSRIASFVFHPFFMTTIAAAVIYNLVPSGFQGHSSNDIGIFIAELSLLTIIFPFASVLLFRKIDLISNTRMHEPKDRIYPLLTALVFYTLAYWFLVKGQPLFIHSLLLGSCLSIFVLFIVTNFYKMSVHTTAAAILAGVCIVLMTNEKITIVPLIIASLVAIIVGVVRWLLGAHTIGQILLGYLVGIFTQMGAYYYLHQ